MIIKKTPLKILFLLLILVIGGALITKGFNQAQAIQLKDMPPMVSNPDPADGATGVSTSPTLTATILEPDGDSVYAAIYDENNNLLNSESGLYDGDTISATWSGLSEGTTYDWSVFVEDKDGNNTSYFSFTTEGGGSSPNAPSNPSPSDGATGVSTDPTLSVDVSDPDGNTMDVSFYDSGDDSLIGTDSGVSSGGTASVTWSSLSRGTTYSWYATAVDTNGSTDSSTYSFNTINGHIPDSPSNPSPSDGATGISTDPTLSVDVSDPDGDSMNVTFYNASDDSIIGTDSGVSSGKRAVVIWNSLSEETSYSWYAVASDIDGSAQSATWGFTTNYSPTISNLDPSDGEVLTSRTSQTLSADVLDPDGGTLNVSFYNATNDSLIGTDSGVSSGGTASVTWSSLNPGYAYSWYAVVDDGITTVQSADHNFTIFKSGLEDAYETGEVSIFNDFWTSVNFEQTFGTTPIILAVPVTDFESSYAGGGNYPIPLVKNITTSGFSITVCIDDGATTCGGRPGTVEDFHWIAFDPSVLSDYNWIEAGTTNSVSTDGSNTGETFSSSFINAPRVWTQAQDYSQGDELGAVAWVDDITTSGFNYIGCVHTGIGNSCDTSNPAEDFGYVAIDVENEAFPDSMNFQWGEADISGSAWTAANFSPSYGVEAVMVTTNDDDGGSDPKYAWARSVTDSGMEFRYCEADDGTTCDAHTGEITSWFALEKPNVPPYAPLSPSPADASTSVDTDPTLEVSVSDPNAGTLDVHFYDSTDDSLIGTAADVSSGSTASVTWSGLSNGVTYSWYAVADDGEFTTQSSLWDFTTNYVPTITNPSPSDGSLLASTDTVALSVDVSDSNDSSLDVSFYDASDDSLIGTDTGVSSGGTASVTWSSLVEGNTYSWYAVASDGQDSTQGTTNSFDINTSPDTPSNVSPSDGATGTLTTVSLESTVSDSDGDLMDVSFYNASDDSLIGTDTGVSSGGTASVSWSSLSEGTTYSWYAVADDGAGSTQGPTWSFTTDYTPNSPTNPNPADGTLTSTSSLTLSVDVSDPDGESMDVEFFVDGGSVGTDTGVPSGGTASIGTTLTDGNHNWYAVADDGSLTSQSDTWSLEIDSTPPSDPNVTVVGQSQTSVDLSWTVNDGESGVDYVRLYFQKSDGTTHVENIDIDGDGDTEYSLAVGLNSSYQITGLEADQDYRYYIRVFDNAGNIKNDGYYAVTTLDYPPNSPTNPSPTDASTGVFTSPTLSVDVSDPDGDDLTVTFYNNADDSVIGSQTGVSSGSTATTSWSGLSNGTTYSWYVKVSDVEDTTQGPAWSFTTNYAPAAPNNPNPADNATVTEKTYQVLEVDVSDTDGDNLDVSFYNADDDSLIGMDSGVLSGNTATIDWPVLKPNTTYNWYAVADDGTHSTQSVTWSFKTSSFYQDLVAWWGFDSGTAPTAADLTGNGFNGTIRGDLYYESAGHDVGNYATLFVNGTDHSYNRRGHNVVHLDSSGNYIGNANFDTYSNDDYVLEDGVDQTCTDCASDQMVTYLDGIPNGDILMISIKDHGANFNNSLLTKLQELGSEYSDEIQTNGTRCSWGMITVVGGEKKAETYEPQYEGPVDGSWAKNMLTVDNSATTSDDSKYYEALNFDDSNDYINIDDDLGSYDEMTISFWFKSSNLDNGLQYFIDTRNNGNFWFIQDYNDCGGRTPDAGNICFDGRVAIQPEDLNENQWYHVAVTENSSETKIYLNGQLKDTGAGETPQLGEDVHIGTRYTNSGYYDGWLDDVRIYNKILASSTIENLAFGGPNLYGHAWSDNIGWISFSHSNHNNNLGYGATLHPRSQEISGYTWSENIGWVTFDREDAGAPPEDDYCASQGKDCLAMIDEEGYNVRGWAWAVAATTTDTWDGWIRMTDLNDGYGVKFNNNDLEMEGYAWSDKIIGWLKFNHETEPADSQEYRVSSLTALPPIPINCQANYYPCHTDGYPAPSGPTLDWENAGASNGYQVEIYSDSGLTNKIYQYETTNAPDASEHIANYDYGVCHEGSNGFQNTGVCQYEYNSDYYWRARLLTADDFWGEWADTETFSISETHHYPYPQLSHAETVLTEKTNRFEDQSQCKDSNAYKLVDYSGYDRTNDTGNTTANFNNGIALQEDVGSVEGYIMYSEQNLHDRFTATSSLHVDNADHFMGIRYNQDLGSWQYDNNEDWWEFTPVESDLIVGEAIWGVSEVRKNLVGDSEVHGIDRGYLKSNLQFIPNQWGGSSNTGEIDIELKDNSCVSGDYNWSLSSTLNQDYDVWDPRLVAGYHLNEGEKETTQDFSENGNSGTLQGDPSWVTGKYGQALDFDGSGDYVEISNDDTLNLSNFTISLWVNPNSWSNTTFPSLISKRDSYSTLDWELFYNNDAGEMRLMVGEGGGSVIFGGQGISAPPVGQWTHVTLVKNGDNYELFYDNSSQGTDISSTSWTDSESLVIGALSSEGDHPFNGTIDEVRVYNEALSGTEITKLYNNEILTNNYQNQGITFYNSTSQDINLSVTDSDGYGACTTSEAIGAETPIEWEESAPIGE